MKSLKFTSVIAALLVSYATGANQLYSWKHTDGTPTFSPDPPPKGVPYEIVGRDLQPLPAQPSASDVAANQIPQIPNTPSLNTPAIAAANAPAIKRAGDIVMTPAPGSDNSAQAPANPALKPAPDWKPVKYADDPNPDANQPVFSARNATADTITPPVNQISAECLDVRQQLMLLESQFANAVTGAEMDTAVVRLNTFRNQNKGYCGL